jgi:hypothetical protein
MANVRRISLADRNRAAAAVQPTIPARPKDSSFDTKLKNAGPFGPAFSLGKHKKHGPGFLLARIFPQSRNPATRGTANSKN